MIIPLEKLSNNALVLLAERMILELSEDPKNQPQIDMLKELVQRIKDAFIGFAKIRESGRDIGITQGFFNGTEAGRKAAADELKFIITKALEDYKASLSRP
jgi:flagellar biosynthesis/type III secretory pathway protein FliH